MPPTVATETICVGARLLQRPDVGAVVHLVRRDAVAVAVAREEHHIARRRCARRSARRKARRTACAPPCAALTSRLASCVEPAAADDREHQLSPCIARISGRLRQKPFASMPQPNTKRSGILRPTKSAVIGFFVLQRLLHQHRAMNALARRARAAARGSRAMVCPPSRMSSSTSTARPRTAPAAAHAPVDPAAARRRAVARDMDIVEVERQAQLRQELAGEHHRAAHHRQHQRIARRRAARSISAASLSTAACDFVGARDQVGVLAGRPRPSRGQACQRPRLCR